MNCKDLLEVCSSHLYDLAKIDVNSINRTVNELFCENKNSKFCDIEFEPLSENDIEESIQNQCEREYLIEEASKRIPEKKLDNREHNFISMLLQVCNMLKNSDYKVGSHPGKGACILILNIE